MREYTFWVVSNPIFDLYVYIYKLLLTLVFKFIVAIEDDYNGPALEDGKVTLKFMKDLIEHYKAQKKLHRKYAYKVSWIFN